MFKLMDKKIIAIFLLNRPYAYLESLDGILGHGLLTSLTNCMSARVLDCLLKCSFGAIIELEQIHLVRLIKKMFCQDTDYC